MSGRLDANPPQIDRLTAEFEDRDLERRFRLAVLPEWQWRLRLNIILIVVSHLFLLAVDYRHYSLSSTFYLIESLRIAVIVLAVAGLSLKFVPRRVRLYDWYTAAFQHAVGVTFCIIFALKDYGVPEGSAMMVVLLTFFYQAIPNRALLTMSASFVTVAGFVALLVLTEGAASIGHGALLAFLVAFGALGVANAFRLARLERKRFARREADIRTVRRLAARGREVRRLTGILAKARNEADRANRAKSAFLANMSHELRTPLNAINGFSEIIKDELFGPVPARYRDYAVDIHRSAMHLTELINEVLDLSKIEAGKLQVHDAPIAPAEVVEAALRLVGERAHAAGLALHTELPPGLPSLRADARMVRQILLNLLTNAVKFTPAGGQVTVAARLAADGAMALVVADTGIGIAVEDIERVIEPYGQVAATRARNPEGIGLGLPLVKKMIELHGGAFRLDSTPGAGTVATVTFPAGRVMPAAPAPHAWINLAEAG
jgi:signal transduction histidine kinase